MIRKIRALCARYLERFLTGTEPITIISEDCWGGEFCYASMRPYTTPLAGAYIPGADYLNFLQNLRQPDAFEIEQVVSSESHPVGRTPYATIHFLHFHDWEEVRTKFPRRVRRIAWDRLFYKIDFGKPDYVQADVDKWNLMRLAPSIAIMPPSRKLDFSKVHNAVLVPDWCPDGKVMFYVARRHFSLYRWLRTGDIRQSLLSQILNVLICDFYFFPHLRLKIRQKLGIEQQPTA